MKTTLEQLDFFKFLFHSKSINFYLILIHSITMLFFLIYFIIINLFLNSRIVFMVDCVHTMY